MGDGPNLISDKDFLLSVIDKRDKEIADLKIELGMLKNNGSIIRKAFVDTHRRLDAVATERDALKARAEHEQATWKVALDCCVQERDTALARVEELEAGIVAHRAGIYSDKEPKCRYNRRLYALLNKEDKPDA